MKTIYLASPFFTPAQLATVKMVEDVVASFPKLVLFSPRKDGGVLQDMKPEQRAKASQGVFESNVNNLDDCNLVLAIVDERDTGTTWELGYAYAKKRKIIAYTSTKEIKLNVMLKYSFTAHACGKEELVKALVAYSKGKALPETKSSGDTY